MDADIKDIKILTELDKNCRQSFSEIANKVGLSQQSVSRRVQRLLDEGVLKQFVTFINLEYLGFRVINICLKLKHIAKEQEQELLRQVSAMPYVNWLCSTSGGLYDLIIGIHAADVGHFKRLFNEITGIFEHEILDDGWFNCMDSFQLPYPLQKRPVEVPNSVGVKLGPIQKLDRIDYLILQELAKNARITNKELAKKFKTGINTITNHIERMERGNVIQGYKPLIDMQKLGYNWHLLLFKLKYVDTETEKQFMEFLKSIPQTFFVVHGVGNWDLQVEFYCKNADEYGQVMNKIFPEKYHKIIKAQHELVILKEHKCTWYPVVKVEEAIQTKLKKWTVDHLERPLQN